MSEASGDQVTTLSARAACAPVVRVEHTDVRMFHLDATRRLKPRALLAVTYPMVFDTWRERFDMAGLVAQGVWPFSSYIEVEATGTPLAGGKPGKFQSSIECGQIAAGRRGAGGLVLATQVSLLAQAGGGDAKDFTQATADAAIAAGRMQIFVNLVRPFAPPDQRAVVALPEQMAGLTLFACEPPPASVDPGPPGSDQRGFESAQAAPRIVWGLPHTDANLTVLSAEYLTRAEDHALVLAREAGLAFAALRPERARIVLKRPFLAGQEAIMRGRLAIAADAKRITAFVTFHALDANGSADDRPAIQVCIDAAA